MKRVGLNYGPSFQGMAGITAGPMQGTATASLSDRYQSSETSYQLHMTTIDLCLQLFTVGMSEGISRRMTKLCVPTDIEELYISQENPELQAEVVASSISKGAISGDAIAMADGKVVLHLKGGKFSPLEGQDTSGDSDTVAAAQLDWKLDIGFIPASNLMYSFASLKEDRLKVEKLALLCILKVRHRIAMSGSEFSHLKKFHSWCDLQAARAEKGEYDIVEEAQILARLNHDERLTLIGTTSKEVEESRGVDIGKVLMNILEYCETIFQEKIDPIEVLLKDDGFQEHL